MPPRDDSTVPSSSKSLIELCTPRLVSLCEAAGFGPGTAEVESVFRKLLTPWGEAPIDPSSPWRSDIADDNTPVELSVAITGGEVEVRALFEVAGTAPTVEAHRQATLAFHERLEREFGADLSRFHAVKDLFLPEGMEGPFAAWNSVVFTRNGPPTFKTYFNPQARGVALAPALMEEGLARLGLDRAWAALSRSVMRRGPHLDELKYFALDLTSTAEARIKVYVRHHGPTPQDLEVACSAARDARPGEALAFARAMRGGSDVLKERAAFTCSAFVGGDDERPSATTLYVPVCAYARDDAEVRARVTGYLVEQGVDPAPYHAVLDKFANRPLEAGVGMQSWASLRRHGDTPRLTVYLATEAREVHAPGTVPAATGDRTTFPSAEAVVETVERYPLREHPFVQRLRRAKDDISHDLWLMIVNTYEGTSKHFVKWLATVTARVEDEHMRCLLAHQLDEELGRGDPNEAHTKLIHDFIKAIEHMRPADFSEELLESGRRLGGRLGQHYMSVDPLEGVAALMAGEICAEQMITTVAELLPPQPHLSAWLTRHEEIEGEHADESMVLAGLVPKTPEAIESIQRGALGVHHALWQSLDELYELCFCRRGGDRRTERASITGMVGS